MTTIANVSKLAGAIVAGAMLLGWNTAEACSLAAWTSSTGSPTAGGPTDANVALRNVKKYVGSCGLMAASGGSSYVVESTQHSAEGNTAPFRGRFYFFTGATAGAPVTVFQALDGENTGNALVAVNYDSTADAVTFTVNGTTASMPAGSAPGNQWVGVSFAYQAGQPFAAATKTMGVRTDLASPPASGAGSIESVRLGLVSAGAVTGNFHFDEYEASRAPMATTDAFTRVCRGDPNNSGSITAADRAAVTAEIGGTAAAGPSDCNESGSVTAADRACITNLIGTLATCTNSMN